MPAKRLFFVGDRLIEVFGFAPVATVLFDGGHAEGGLGGDEGIGSIEGRGLLEGIVGSAIEHAGAGEFAA